MTYSVQTSVFKTRRHMASDFYSVEVINYEGESFDYEIEAHSFSEASEIAGWRAAEDGIDVYQMNCYKY